MIPGPGLGIKNPMRWLAALSAALAVFCAVSAMAADCPGKPDALGTSRTLVVDPASHPQIGTINYSETLPLAEREVVLTFDDGPRPPYTGKVLDILAAECVQATFFVVGKMADEYPGELQKVFDAGHTIGTHSHSHPIYFDALSPERAELEIEVGIAAATMALGKRGTVAPFFRYPGLGRTMKTEDYLTRRGQMVWSADVLTDDWKRVGARGIIHRAIARLEERGKGILLLHDVNPATIVGLPGLLRALKDHGFRIVHVVPQTKDRPHTVSSPQDWQVPWAVAKKRWPRRYPFARANSGHELAVPGPQLFQFTDIPERTTTARTVRTVSYESENGRRKRIVAYHRIVEFVPFVQASWPPPQAADNAAEPTLAAPSASGAGVEYALQFRAPEPPPMWATIEQDFANESEAAQLQPVALAPRVTHLPR